jgi:hypothetical protein
MNVHEYMKEDLQLIKSEIEEFMANYRKWSPVKCMEKASELFHTLKRHFDLEDFTMGLFKPTPEMRAALQQFLKERLEFRANLENILMLHIDEPDFVKEIGLLLQRTKEYIEKLETKYKPAIFYRISAPELEHINAELLKRIHSWEPEMTGQAKS